MLRRARPLAVACAAVAASYAAIRVYRYGKACVVTASVSKGLNRDERKIVRRELHQLMNGRHWPCGSGLATAISDAAEKLNVKLVQALVKASKSTLATDSLSYSPQYSNYDAAAKAITASHGRVNEDLVQILDAVLSVPTKESCKRFVHGAHYDLNSHAGREPRARMWEVAVKSYCADVPHEKTAFGFLEARVSFKDSDTPLDTMMGCANATQWLIDCLTQAVNHKQPELVRRLLASPHVRPFRNTTFLAAVADRAAWSHSFTSFMASPVQIEHFKWAQTTIKEWPKPTPQDLLDMASTRVGWPTLSIFLGLADKDTIEAIKPHIVKAVMWRPGPDHATLKGVSESVVHVPPCTHKCYSDICPGCVVDKPNKKWPRWDGDTGCWVCEA